MITFLIGDTPSAIKSRSKWLNTNSNKLAKRIDACKYTAEGLRRLTKAVTDSAIPIKLEPGWDAPTTTANDDVVVYLSSNADPYYIITVVTLARAHNLEFRFFRLDPEASCLTRLDKVHWGVVYPDIIFPCWEEE